MVDTEERGTGTPTGGEVEGVPGTSGGVPGMTLLPEQLALIDGMIAARLAAATGHTTAPDPATSGAGGATSAATPFFYSDKFVPVWHSLQEI